MKTIAGCFLLVLLVFLPGYGAEAATLPPPPQAPAFPGGTPPDTAPQRSSGSSSAHLILLTHPPGALVNLGGFIIGETPLDQHVHPGSNIWLTVSKNGYLSQTMMVLLRSGHTLSLDLPLRPIPSLPQPYVP